MVIAGATVNTLTLHFSNELIAAHRYTSWNRAGTKPGFASCLHLSDMKKSSDDVPDGPAQDNQESGSAWVERSQGHPHQGAQGATCQLAGKPCRAPAAGRLCTWRFGQSLRRGSFS
jgi:hypothetical protein